MRGIVIIAALAITGCAWSAEGLRQAELENVYMAESAPDIVAGCISTRLNGVNPMARVGEGHYVVTRMNGYGIPIVRWDIFANEGGGSRVEFRRSMAIMSGEERAATCFTAAGVADLSN